MSLSKKQFKEWKTSFDPSTHARVPQSRFEGMSGLGEALEIGHLDPEDANATIANAVPYAMGYAKDIDMPIEGLSAHHHINRQNARNVYESIKSRGYDPSERILVTGDSPEWGATILEGHHRAVAARAAGMKTIPATFLPTHALLSAIEANSAYS